MKRGIFSVLRKPCSLLAQHNSEKEVDLYLNDLETDFDDLKNKYYEKSMGPDAIKDYIEFAVDKQIDKIDEY